MVAEVAVLALSLVWLRPAFAGVCLVVLAWALIRRRKAPPDGSEPDAG